jgi:uncharacterized protein YndB with AHSA1/START domain
MVGEGREIEHNGVFEKLEPGRRIRFTWRSAYTAGDSVVTVELRALGNGTELTLVHDRLPEGHGAPHRGGWSSMLDRLAALLGGTA